MRDMNNENEKKLPVLEDRELPGIPNTVFGVNTPEIFPPAKNPPVPNRAWTAMRAGRDIEELSMEERRELYLGNDDIM